MVAIKAHLVEQALKTLNPQTHVFLMYGPDTGLVTERAVALVKASGVDEHDPFQLVRLSADELTSDPARLIDEAFTRGLFGGERVIRVQVGGKNICEALKPVLSENIAHTRIILEAGDLAKSSPVRALCEASPFALALPCYSDGNRDLMGVIEHTVAKAGLRIQRDAKEWLATHVGADRASTRSELEKLMLYARGETEITLSHVMAVIGDASALQLDDLIDHAFSGNIAACDTDFFRLHAEGTDASLMMNNVLRHCFLLHSLHHHMRDALPFKVAVKKVRNIHFSREKNIEQHLHHWRSSDLPALIHETQRLTLACRQMPELKVGLSHTHLMRIARKGRRSENRV
jgi:DNA polymerase III subunit delta